MNVLVENDEQGECNKITLVEFAIDKDMQRRPAVQVCFDRQGKVH